MDPRDRRGGRRPRHLRCPCLRRTRRGMRQGSRDASCARAYHFIEAAIERGVMFCQVASERRTSRRARRRRSREQRTPSLASTDEPRRREAERRARRSAQPTIPRARAQVRRERQIDRLHDEVTQHARTRADSRRPTRSRPTGSRSASPSSFAHERRTCRAPTIDAIDHVAQRELGLADAVEERRAEVAERAEQADEAQDARGLARTARAARRSTCRRQ